LFPCEAVEAFIEAEGQSGAKHMLIVHKAVHNARMDRWLTLERAISVDVKFWHNVLYFQFLAMCKVLLCRVSFWGFASSSNTKRDYLDDTYFIP
jgi:hypothetical protein